MLHFTASRTEVQGCTKSSILFWGVAVLSLSPTQAFDQGTYSVYVNQYESELMIDDMADCQGTCCTDQNDGTMKQYDLHQNDTQHIVYQVTSLGRQFELSIRAATTDVPSGEQTQQAGISIQPWETFPAAASESSPELPDFAGSVQLTGIGNENYKIFDNGDHSYVLTQTSLDDEGESLFKQGDFGKMMLDFAHANALSHEFVACKQLQFHDKEDLRLLCRHFN